MDRVNYSEAVDNKENLTYLLEQMISVTEEFLKLDDQPPDYQTIVNMFVDICSAKYAVFNLFSLSGQNFETLAFSGNSTLAKKVASILGFTIVGKKWDSDPVYMSKIEGRSVTRFENLHAIVGNSLPRFVVDMVVQLFKLGEVYVFTIKRYNRILGEFTVFLEKDQAIEHIEMVELFTNQVGLLLTRYQSEQALLKERVFVDAMAKTIDEYIIMTDMKGFLTYTNDVVLSLSEVDETVLIGKHIYECLKIIGVTDNMPLSKDYRNIYDDGISVEVHDTIMEMSRYGETSYVEYSLTPLSLEHVGELGYLFVMRDITNKHLEHQHIQFLSKHDQLTSLYNRRYFEETLVFYNQSKDLPISIIMGDVNGLKLINDSFGHQYGDELLIKAADLLKANCREQDILARIGGDEFVMIMPNTTTAEATSIVDVIKNASNVIEVMGTTLSISMGIASKVNMQQELTKILYEAEEEMYKHKLFESTSMHSRTLELVINSLFEKNEREMHHSQRVSALCSKVAELMGYNLDRINRIALAGLMHDIGKIGIPEKILNKPTKFNEEEYDIVKRHSEIGYRILSSVNEFSDISKYILEHHERVDGKGYPKGLAGDDIHPFARIIGVCDAFDTMTSKRTYGKVMTEAEALDELKRFKGSQFDADVVAIIEKIYTEGK